VLRTFVKPTSGEVRVEKVWFAGEVGGQIIIPSLEANHWERASIDGVPPVRSREMSRMHQPETSRSR
jgi:hypothetical protein